MSIDNSPAAMTAPSEADKAAVANLPQRIVAAWKAHDAEAFAEVFTEDATMILPGLYRKGRDEIRSFMAAAFAGQFKGTQVTGDPLDIRLFNGTAGVVVTQGGVLAPGESEVSDERAIRASWVVVKENGEWKLAAYQNSPRDAA
ncbi:SgcJ/EcaC family oxidoreductase [Salinactinospora qingdaonensis]|uniref:SgcJ/EcaC family oxidoreductase n=1 Tax=Salinactinospora qingdaonensis TaxID=702744 RepID=A0ABP7FVH9_9ACTN